MRISPRTTVNLYALGFVIAGVGQSVMNRRVGKNSRWGESGWQREVVIWTAGTVASIAALRATKGEPDRALATGFTALSAMFAANHMYAIVRENGGGVMTHVEALALNLGGIALGVAALRNAKDSGLAE